MSVAKRGAVPPFQVMAILDRVAELRAAGRNVVSLCAGEPAQGAPADVHDRAARLHLDRAPATYSGPLGLAELRHAVAGHYRRWYGLAVGDDDVAISTGASGAFLLTFLAAFDVGDRVAVVRPGYPAYRNILQALGVHAVEVAAGPAERFQPTPELLDRVVAAGGPIHGLVLASPANPTGSMVDRAGLAALVAWCDRHRVRLISDEIYHGITYPPDRDAPDARGVCAWDLGRDAVVVSSFSKYWGMTGWRLGWALVPPDLRPAVDALAGNVALCPPVPAQVAAVAAFTERSYGEAERRVDDFAATRAVLLDRVARLGWGPVAPADGAFYCYVGLGPALGRHRDAGEWCRALLDEAGVAVVPGTDFDPVDGGGYVRLSLAAGTETVTEALDRIATWTAHP